MFDREMRYLSASHRWFEDYGLAAQTISGRSHYEIFPEIPERWRLIHRRCLNGAVERAEEDLFIRADGRKQWLRWEVRPWFRGRGRSKVGGLIMFSEDITTRKLAEERALELARQNDIEMRLRAEHEQVNRQRDEFIAVLSHELRTPLHAILGWTQLARRTEPTSPRIAEALRAVEQSARTQARLIGDILDMHRLSAGKLRLDITSVQLATSLAAALETVAPQVEQHGIEIKTVGALPEITVQGDPTRLQQSLWNILSNAIKFSSRGGRIEIRCSRHSTTAELSVRDFGAGIDPAALPRIFEPFTQASSASTRTHGGLGLGLAITRYLIELHGGSVTATSAGLGHGTTVTVTLPLETPATLASSPAVVAHSEIMNPTALAGRSLLIVEDNLEAREMIRALLEDFGAAITSAPSVETAVALAAAKRPELVITDLNMPDHDGYELARCLQGVLPGVPIIAVSGCVSEADRARTSALGFSAHLAKPVEAPLLVQIIQTILAGQHHG